MHCLILRGAGDGAPTPVAVATLVLWFDAGEAGESWMNVTWIRGPRSRAISTWVSCVDPSGVMLVGVRGYSGVGDGLAATQLVHLVTEMVSPISWKGCTSPLLERHPPWATFRSLRSDQGWASRGTWCCANLGWLQHVGALPGLCLAGRAGAVPACAQVCLAQVVCWGVLPPLPATCI